MYINWSQYDDLLRRELPHMTIKEFRDKYLPGRSTKAVGARAKKLSVKPKKYRPTSAHKNKIANGVAKGYDIKHIRAIRDQYSLKEISSKFNIPMSTLNRLIKKHNIKLSDDGRDRAREESINKQLGKQPWNKGIPLPEEIKVKIAKARQQQSGKLSQIQTAFYRILDDLRIEYYAEHEPECRIGHWLFDCRIPRADGNDILVEVQGDYWHSLPKNQSKDNAKWTYINRYFPNLQVRYIWEHEFGCGSKVASKVREWLGIDKVSQIDFDFSDVTICEISSAEAAIFLAAHHYLGRIGARIFHAAKLNNNIIAILAWGPPTRKEVATRLGIRYSKCFELRRFCIHESYHKKNFGSWLLARSCRLFEYDLLVSFADPDAGHDGCQYRAAGWEYNGTTEPSYFYVDEEGYVMHKKTLYNNANKMHMTEREFADTYKYTKVRSNPKLRYIKREHS